MQSSCAPALLSAHTLGKVAGDLHGDFSDRFVPQRLVATIQRPIMVQPDDG